MFTFENRPHTLDSVLWVINNYRDVASFKDKDREAGHEELGLVRLGKILWFADKAYYRRYYETISEMDYFKRDKGPAPEELMSVLNYLEFIKKIQIDKPNSSRDLYCFTPKSHPDVMTPEKERYLEDAVRHVRDRDIQEVIEETHDDLFNLVEDGAKIPMAATLISLEDKPDGELSDEEKKEAWKYFTANGTGNNTDELKSS